jgi:hypothetical protein
VVYTTPSDTQLIHLQQIGELLCKFLELNAMVYGGLYSNVNIFNWFNARAINRVPFWFIYRPSR